MCRLENGVSGFVVDVAARGHADAADLGCEDIGDIIAVLVQGHDDSVLFRMQNGILQEGVAGHAGQRQAARGQIGAIFPFGHVVGPVAECTFGVFHDVAVMHQRDAAAIVAQGIVDRATDDPFNAFAGHGFDAIGGGFRESDFLFAHLVQQEVAEFLCFFRAEGPFDTGIDVLGTFADNADVDPFRVFHGRGYSVEIADGAVAGVEVQGLAEHHAEGAYAAACGGHQRSLQTDSIFAEGFDGRVREIGAVFLEGFLAGVHFEPVDGPVAVVGPLDRGVHHGPAYRRNLLADTVTHNVRDRHPIRDPQSIGSFHNLIHILSYYVIPIVMPGLTGHLPIRFADSGADFPKIRKLFQESLRTLMPVYTK